MKCIVVISFLLGFLGATQSAYAIDLCVYEEDWPEKPRVIEYWIDDSVWEQSWFSHTLTGEEAEHQIKVALERFYPDTGAVKFKFMGRSYDQTCDGVTPTLIVQGLECNGSWAGYRDNPGNCAYATFYTSPPEENCLFEGYDSMYSIVNHEVMHALGMHHTYECEETYDHISSTGSNPGRTDRLTAADKQYLRTLWGFDETSLRYQYASPFLPLGDSYQNNPFSRVSLGYAINNVISPVNMASNYDKNRGLVYNVPGIDSSSNVRAYLCEPFCSLQTPASYTSYHRPDIATSLGRNPDHWMVAYLYGEHATNIVKDIMIAEKDQGATSWNLSSLDVNTHRSEISVDYEYHSDTYIITYVDSNGTGPTADDNLVFAVRSRMGGEWTETSLFGPFIEASFPIQTSEGATIACDDYYWLAPDLQNCVVIWADVDPWQTLMWAPFRVNDDHIIELGDVYSMGISSYSLPSVVSNPGNGENSSEPEFLLVYSLLSNTIYTRKKTVFDTYWSSGGLAATYAGSYFFDDDKWYRPVGAGTRQNTSYSYDNFSYVVYGE